MGVFYAFSPVPQQFLSLDAAAGITKMRFTVDDELEDQDGLGFPLQDSVVLAASSCLNFSFNGSLSGRVDIAVRVARYVIPYLIPGEQVRNSITPTRIFIEAEMSDHTGAPIVVEIDVPRPSEPAAANATYTIWSVPVNSDQPYNMFTVGAEIDGVGKLLGPHLPFAFFPC
jgi:hypothetical protein